MPTKPNFEPTEFSEALRAARTTHCGYTQIRVHQETEIPRCKLSRYETGAQVPREITFEKLIKYYLDRGLICFKKYNELKILYTETVKTRKLENHCLNH